MMIEIRRVGIEDFALFQRVADDVFDEPVCSENLHAYLAEPTHRMVVAMAGDLMVGQVAAVLHRHPDKPTELYIDEVGVSPSHRRQGIATSLMAEITAWGRELGCASAWLGTEVDNEPAKALYQRHATPEPFLMYPWKLPKGVS